MDNTSSIESMLEAKRAIDEKRSLVSQLNALTEQFWVNPYSEELKWKIEAAKEKINRINKKIKVYKLKDLNRD